MSLALDALLFGLTFAFTLVGLVGIILPILPGTVIIWLSILVYTIFDGFEAIGVPAFVILTLIALVTGTADVWMSLLGSKVGGASRRAMLFGMIGAVLGFFLLGAAIPIVGNLVGGVIGYASGVLLGQYHKHQDWNLAVKASVGGVAGWGVATAIQLGGGLFMILIFVWQVLSY